MNKPLVDKIQKHEAEEFHATTDDDAERAEFWLENTIRVFDELSCTSDEFLKCVVSLLRDMAYHWWKMLISVVPKNKSLGSSFRLSLERSTSVKDLSIRNAKSFLS